jgi:hypothetical protein
LERNEKLKYDILNLLSGSLGLPILSVALTQRLKRLLSRSLRIKLETSFSVNGNMMTPEDEVIISGLIKFWNASSECNSSTELENSPWHEFQGSQTKLQEIMLEGVLKNLSVLLSSPTQAICNGIL